MKVLERAIHELLKEFAGGRVHSLRAAQNSVAPFVVFQRTDSDRWRDVNGPAGMAQAYIQVDVYGGTYFATKELALAIENKLDGFRNVVYYGVTEPKDFIRIAGISTQNDLDTFDQTDEPFLFRSTATYLVTYEQ